jgi:hypothetical protein
MKTWQEELENIGIPPILYCIFFKMFEETKKFATSRGTVDSEFTILVN